MPCVAAARTTVPCVAAARTTIVDMEIQLNDPGGGGGGGGGRRPQPVQNVARSAHVDPRCDQRAAAHVCTA